MQVPHWVLNQSWGAAEHDQKLTRPGEAHRKFAHQIRAKSDQRFICKCAETARPIRGQEMAGILQGVTKN